MNNEIEIGKADGGGATRVRASALLTTKMLVTANSGGGKSYLLRKLFEGVGTTAQLIVLDMEGEFVTLREKLDLVIVGPGGEIPADVRSAGLLVRRLLERELSAVVDMSEMRADARRAFVRRFCETLVELPKTLWRPLFVGLDEAHQFAPEKGQGEAESTNAVIDLCTLGRKRGFCPILATQRISTLHKTAAGECNNKFIGRMTLDVDLKRAAFELGVSPADAVKMLRDLKAGEFYGFGPALSSPGVGRVTVGKVETTHPKAGQGQTLTPPKPSKTISAVVAELSDLPQQAEAEIKDLAAARAKIRELEKLVKEPGTRDVVKEKVVEVPVLKNGQLDRAEKAAERFNSIVEKLRVEADRMVGEAVSLRDAIAPASAPRPATPVPVAAVARNIAAIKARPATENKPPVNAGAREELPGPERKVLDSLAFWESVGVTAPGDSAVALCAGYSPGSSAYERPRGKLRAAGLIEFPNAQTDARSLTDAGRQLALQPAAPATLAALHEQIRSVLPGPEWKLLNNLINAYPGAMTNAELATASGYSEGSSAYERPRGKLRTYGLAEFRDGGVAATKILFPDGLD